MLGCLGKLFALLITLAIILILVISYLYKPVTTGTLSLKNAKGEAEVIREVETSIPHVYASNELMMYYS